MKVARGAEFMRTMFKKVAAALAAFNESLIRLKPKPLGL
jgi:hypothetical protein